MALFETAEERRIRERAEQRQKQYESEIGEKVPEEPGIEEDTTLEDMAMSLMGPGGAAAKGMRMAANEGKKIVKKAVFPRLRDMGPPKLLSEAAPASSGSIGGMGHNQVPQGAGSPNSPYKKYKPTRTQASTGWESGSGYKVRD